MTITAHQAILALELRRQGCNVMDVAAELKVHHSTLEKLFRKPPIVAVSEYMTPQFIRTSTDLIKRAIERRKSNASKD